jgi:hypothetical protein
MQADSRMIVEFPSKEGSQYVLVGREKHAANADCFVPELVFKEPDFTSFSTNMNWIFVSACDISLIALAQ